MEDDKSLAVFTEEKFEPCRVCGEHASGWHCGAVTCEACKKFYLRSINGEDAKYKCIRNKDCVIMRSTRTTCQYCRFQKCLEVGMTTKPISNPTVTEIFKRFQCQVCKAPSSGIHFGAITCEGCKGFFRRSIKERAPERYRCMENGNCQINASTRNMCRFCRFQLCVKAGMSSETLRFLAFNQNYSPATANKKWVSKAQTDLKFIKKAKRDTKVKPVKPKACPKVKRGPKVRLAKPELIQKAKRGRPQKMAEPKPTCSAKSFKLKVKKATAKAKIASRKTKSAK